MRSVYIIFIGILAGAIYELPLHADNWAKAYGGIDSDAYVKFISQTSDGGYMVMGQSYSYGAGGYDVLVIKLDSMGNIKWAKTFGWSGSSNWANLYSGLQTFDNGYIFTSNAPGEACLVLKLDSVGVIEWAKSFNLLDYEYLFSVSQTSDSGYILTGFKGANQNVWVIKLNSMGELEWAKEYGSGSSHTDAGYSVLQTSDLGYIVAGYTGSGAGGTDFLVIKLNSTGELQWDKAFGGTSTDVAHSISETSDSGYIVTGETHSYGAGDGDVLVIKLDFWGGLEWTRTFGDTAHDYAYSGCQTQDNGYIVAGATNSYDPSGNALVIKLDSMGRFQWAKTFGDNDYCEGQAISQTTDNGYIVSGTTFHGAGSHDFLVIKPESDGSMDASCPIQDCFPDTSSPTVTVTSSFMNNPIGLSVTVNDCPPETSSVSPTVTDICEGGVCIEEKELISTPELKLSFRDRILTFSIPSTAYTSLNLYDISGRRVKTLIDKYMEKGSYKVKLSNGIPSGIYFAVLTHRERRTSHKVVLF